MSTCITLLAQFPLKPSAKKIIIKFLIFPILMKINAGYEYDFHRGQQELQLSFLLFFFLSLGLLASSANAQQSTVTPPSSVLHLFPY